MQEDDKALLPESVIEHRYAVYSFVKAVHGDELLQPNDYLIESEKFGVPQRRHRVILLGIRADYDNPPHPVLEEIDTLYSFADVLGNMCPVRSRMSGNDEGPQEWRKRVSACLSEKALKTKDYRAVYDRMKAAVKEMPEKLGEGGQYLRGEWKPDELVSWLYDERRD